MIAILLYYAAIGLLLGVTVLLLDDSDITVSDLGLLFGFCTIWPILLIGVMLQWFQNNGDRVIWRRRPPGQ